MSSMDRSSYYNSSSSPSSSPPSPNTPRPNKVIMQRQYRSKEGECFNTLRDIIHKLSGEVLQTRHEILKKAIELLLACPEARKLRQIRADYSTVPHGIYPPVDFNATSDYIDLSLQSSSSSQIWHSEPDVQTAYYFPSQQYPFVSVSNPTFSQGGYDESCSHSSFH